MGEHGINISRVRFKWLEKAIQHGRDLVAGIGSQGGYTVGSKSPFPVIEYLGAQLACAKAGAQVVPIETFGPVPKVSSVAAAGWIGESGGVTEPNFTFTSVPTSPKTVAAFADVSRILNAQTGPVAEGVVVRELLGANARAVDTAVLHGTGAAGQPLGIAGSAGVDTRSGASFAIATATGMLKAIETANADSTAAVWLMDPASADLLRKREIGTAGAGLIIANGKMLGLPVLVSNSVSAGFIFIGDFREVVVAVRSIEVLRNPFSQSKGGFIEVGVYWVGDILLRHPGAFSVATSVS
jgi:HK97 family phage major capsid protein